MNKCSNLNDIGSDLHQTGRLERYTHLVYDGIITLDYAIHLQRRYCNFLSFTSKELDIIKTNIIKEANE